LRPPIIDASYTLGDLAAKLTRLLENLDQIGLLGRNKRLLAPVEFVRVDVTSPETSAALGDSFPHRPAPRAAHRRRRRVATPGNMP
jgi:exonuclease VII large subunit